MRSTVLDAATLEKLISAAVAAPSIHNTQPWRFRLEPETATIEVHAAAERALHHTDPEGRALHLSVGTALFNLRVAVGHLGWEPDVRLLPDPARPGLLATLRPVERTRGTNGRGLYDAIWRRHSSRLPFSAERPPQRLLAALAAAAGSEGARAHFPDREETVRLLRLTAEAEGRDHSDAGRRSEGRQWIRDASEDGLPRAALGPQDATGRLPVRDFSSLRPEDHQPAQAFEAEPLVAVLSTTSDSRGDWLRAGQALEHVLLLATASGLSSSLLHQALEWPDLRWESRDTRCGPGFVQMMVRLGYGPRGHASPRRTVREVLESSGAGTARG